ncbi:MAG: ABC transporter substrate-binding protein [Nevskiales bacterium]
MSTETTRHEALRLTRRKALSLLGASPLLAHPTLRAQTVASGVVSMVVPYPAGGQADAVARVVQAEFQRTLGQTVIVENAPGGSGSIAVSKVLSAAPDGRTLLVGTPLELIQAPLGLAAVKHKPEQFRMLRPIAGTSLLLLVRPDLPVANVAELVALAKKSSAKEMTYCSSGKGSIFHLVAERFAIDTGLKLLQVPYRGGAQMLPALAGGEIDFGFIPLGGPVIGMIKTGRLKPLAITATARHPALPEVPTMNETGLVKGFEFDAWAALLASRALPDALAAKLNAAMGSVTALPQVRKELETAGMTMAAPMDLAAADRFYAAEAVRYQSIAKAIDLQPE